MIMGYTISPKALRKLGGSLTRHEDLEQTMDLHAKHSKNKVNTQNYTRR